MSQARTFHVIHDEFPDMKPRDYVAQTEERLAHMLWQRGLPESASLARQAWQHGWGFARKFRIREVLT